MNIIKVNVNFKNRTITKQGVDLTEGDYNSTKMVFTFDREDGTKVLEMKNPNDEIVLHAEIENNEVILGAEQDGGGYASIFNEVGNYTYEVVLYDGDSKLTSASDYIKIKKKQIDTDGETAEIYKPVFDEMMGDLNEALYEVDNLDIDVSKSGSVATVTISKKDGTSESVNISDGESGPANTLSIGTVVKGNDAEATITGDAPNQTLNLVLPKGDKGEKGDTGNTGATGPSNVLSIGIVTKGENASATITGTSPNQFLNLVLPKGDKGDTGEAGPQGNPGANGTNGTNGQDGFSPIATVTQTQSGATISITDKNGTTTANVSNGQDGEEYDDTEIRGLIAGKQGELVSGTNIKTINNTSLLGSGNIEVLTKDKLFESTTNENIQYYYSGIKSLEGVELSYEGESISLIDALEIIAIRPYSGDENITTINQVMEFIVKYLTVPASVKEDSIFIVEMSGIMSAMFQLDSEDNTRINRMWVVNHGWGFAPYTLEASGSINSVTINVMYIGQNTSARVTSLSSSSTDTQYPSAKCVYDELQLKQNVTDNTLTTTNKTVPTAINEVNSIAKGANKAISYSNYQSMITQFNTLGKDYYNVGQSIYIVTLNVPDLWISGMGESSSTYTYVDDATFINDLQTNGYVQVGYHKFSMLETLKVDLTNYQTKIDSTHKLSSDLVDDINKTNKFVTSTEKTTWNNKYSKPSSGIPSTDLASAVQTSLDKADSAIQSSDLTDYELNTNKVTSISSSSTNTEYPSALAVYNYIQSLDASEVSY